MYELNEKIDIRDRIFQKIEKKKITAGIYTDMDGILSGLDRAVKIAGEIGVSVNYAAAEGDEVYAGDLIMQFTGNPKQIAIAEDRLIAALSKYSGVATAAHRFVKAAGTRLKVVGGAWKKMPEEIKIPLKAAARAGGAGIHMLDEPMVYLDKNYVEMFGGIQKTLMAIADIKGRKKIIQIRGRYEGGDIVREAFTAAASGADIIFVDTGNIEDLRHVTSALKPALAKLEEKDGYRKVYFAYAGGIGLSDLDAVADAGADFIDIGRNIVDAPLLDMRMEVTLVDESDHSYAHYDLLDKNELKIEGIFLKGTNLTELAAVVADEIGIDREDVLVIDVRGNVVALDILRSMLDPEKFVSKENAILERLAALDGVTLEKGAKITSNGMLGWIACDEAELADLREDMERSRNLGTQVMQKVAQRAIVFPTGAEVENGEIEDTNSPLIMKKFTDAGFKIIKGEILKDDIELFTIRLRQAAEMGFGVSITTGGVGAENKDFSVEAIEQLDPTAATPYIAKFKAGHGRHSKDGIRIGVGQYGATTYIALPGPNDEVSICIDTVVKGIKEGWGKEVLAGEIARILRNRLKEKIGFTGNHK